MNTEVSRRIPAGLVALAAALSLGCSPRVNREAVYKMGEEVKAGSVVYTVTDSEWRMHLGDGFDQLVPKHRFLLVRLNIHNAGDAETALPLLQVEDGQGKAFMEESELKGVPDALGLLRIMPPDATLRGVIVFDVPSAAYRLRVSDGGALEEERTALVEIPLDFGAPPAIDLPEPASAPSAER
ncbi:MAG: DUF4352 domain-containing protein [Bryobacteraceae bacterium]|nr:DUF4352 domain-containing protein [Bryobacteraceae bacterium]